MKIIVNINRKNWLIEKKNPVVTIIFFDTNKMQHLFLLNSE